MLKDYSGLTCLVWDYGVFEEFAVLLSKHFGKVYFHSPWRNSFLYQEKIWIGRNIPDIERVDEWEDVVDDVDLFVFPDINSSGIQLQLEDAGKRVWGSRRGEELEIDRVAAKKLFEKLGIPVGPYEVIKGMKKLREFLKNNDEQYVKSEFRGNMETFFSPSYDIIKPRLDAVERSFVDPEDVVFVCEEPLPGVEDGYDGYCIDGEYPKMAFRGIEAKDKGYIIEFTKASSIRGDIIGFNEAISSTMKKYHYRNFFSTEMRKDKILDPCCRAGNPPNSIYINMIKNLPDILWFGAEGECIDPEVDESWGAELIMYSPWSDKNLQPVHFPEEIRDQVKLKFFTKIGEIYNTIPQNIEFTSPGSVVASGKTMEEAIKKVRKYAEQVEGYDIELFPECLDDIQEQMK